MLCFRLLYAIVLLSDVFDARARARARAQARVCVGGCVVHWHCTAQLSMFNMEKRFRNKIIIIIIKSLYGCFPSLPPMLLRGFESRLGLESSGCSMWHFLKLVARGFLRVLRFPPLLHWFNGSANKIKLK